MEDDSEEVLDLAYLPKLLLQYENSPYLDNEDLVDASEHLPLVCSLDSSSGKYMCVAFGRRMVVFPTARHTHPVCFVSAVTPSPQEVVTCVSFLGGSGWSVSSKDDSHKNLFLIIGTSKGGLQVHSINNDCGAHACLHRQRVAEKAITNIRVTDCDNGGIISAGTRDGIVLVHCIDVLSVWQWHKKGREAPDMDAHAWEFYTVGPRHASLYVPCKATPRVTSLHSALIDMNRSNHVPTREHDEMLILSAGKDPPIALYALHEKDWMKQKGGILSSLVTMSSKMLFGRKRTGDDHPHRQVDLVVEHSEMQHPLTGNGTDRTLKKHTTLSSPYTSVWDDTKRDCFGLDVSSSGAWAACCDTLGRILIVSVRDGCIFKMLKGYRDCQVAWINVAEDDAKLFIYAPKRMVLELWDVCRTGRKMKTIRNNVTDKGLLIGTTQRGDSSLAILMGMIAAKLAGRSGSSSSFEELRDKSDRSYDRMGQIRYYTTLAMILMVIIGYDVMLRCSFGQQGELLFAADTGVAIVDQESMQVHVTAKNPSSAIHFIQEEDRHPKIHVQNGWDKSMRTDDDLFSDVDIPVALSPGFQLTDFDKHVLQLDDDGFLVLHQMWKNPCVLNAKIDPMKSWEDIEGERLRVIFWTDDSMEYFMQTHFNGTDVMKFWRFLDSAERSGIKKSDFFRVVIVWFYGSIYVDLDIRIKASLQPLLDQGLTTMMWEGVDRYRIMTPNDYSAFGQDWRTLMLSGFVSSGIRFSDFLGFYINWSVRNFLSGRKKGNEEVLSSVGPIAEAEAYKYYVSRVNKHDRLFRVMAYEEFLNVYGDHLTESTWVLEHPEKEACTNVTDIYSDRIALLAPRSAQEEHDSLERARKEAAGATVKVTYLDDSAPLEALARLSVDDYSI